MTTAVVNDVQVPFAVALGTEQWSSWSKEQKRAFHKRLLDAKLQGIEGNNTTNHT